MTNLPIILALYVLLPSADTPPLTYYERQINPPRWHANQPEGARLCREVQITFATEIYRTYWVETSKIQEPKPWEIGKPNHVFNQWRICSEPIIGTGSNVTWRGGCPWDRSWWRVARE